MDRLQIGAGTIPERGNPGRITTEAEIATEMTTAVDHHAPRLVAGGLDTEIATGRDIALRAMTVVAEATVAAAVLVEAAHTMVTKARKLSWKDYRWIWWKKTLDNSFLPPHHTAYAFRPCDL